MSTTQARTPHRGANITKITSDLYIGGDLSALKDKRDLQVLGIIEAGITHIIDMRIEANDAELWADHGIRYLNLGTDDAAGHHIPDGLFDAAVSFARASKAQGGKVLAHCHMGVNRGPSAGFAIMLDRGFDAATAFDMIRARRPQAAVWYAEDALGAHLSRNSIPRKRARRIMARFSAHRARVFTAVQRLQTQHYIRGQHQAGYDEQVQLRGARRSDRLEAALAVLAARQDGHGYVYRGREHEVESIALH